MEDEESSWRDVTRKRSCWLKVERLHNNRINQAALSGAKIGDLTRF